MTRVVVDDAVVWVVTVAAVDEGTGASVVAGA